MFATQATSDVIPIHVVDQGSADAWLSTQTIFAQAVLGSAQFTGALGQVVVVPGASGAPEFVAAGFGSPERRRRVQFPLGNLRNTLPPRIFEFTSGLDGEDLENATLAWALSGYRFDRYKANETPKADLHAAEGANPRRLTSIAEGVFLTQTLIDTPTNDMGPDTLEQAVRTLGSTFGAPVCSIVGEALLAENFPLIHTVGRASGIEPRLVELTWGSQDAPKVTLVGKGVCFDTGGLNIKPGSSMGLMKKDMGGAATVLGLAYMIMAQELPVRLRVLVPAVENAIGGSAFRPGDILTSRKGLTVEVNNTDAEGRLVLADALALADEESPETLICMATLTGAARVALGPDVVPYFTDDRDLSAALDQSSRRVADPLWPMPFWPGYEPMIEPGIADLDNAPKGGMAGAITAALFLNRFVENAGRFVHLDCYGWTPTAKPARPKGGACQGARALFDMLAREYGDGV